MAFLKLNLVFLKFNLAFLKFNLALLKFNLALLKFNSMVVTQFTTGAFPSKTGNYKLLYGSPLTCYPYHPKVDSIIIISG